MSEFIQVDGDDATQSVLNIKCHEDFVALKAAYESALNEDKTSFTFQDGELLIHYAKYLIEYLEGRGADELPSRGGSA